MLGPVTLHVPVPFVGVFAANVADVLVHIVCGLPATEVVVGGVIVTLAVVVEFAEAHAPLVTTTL